MKDLHNNMDEWQKDNEKRFLSVSVNKDGYNYCRIPLTNPSEVTITNDDLNVNLVSFDNKDDINVTSRYADLQVEVVNTVEVSGSVSVD